MSKLSKQILACFLSNCPSFSVVWKGNYLDAGNGPFYEPDVLGGIAKLGAMRWHDIYQIDDEETDE